MPSGLLFSEGVGNLVEWGLSKVFEPRRFLGCAIR